MLLILLEALGAGLILVLIVWWTMFSGRRDGERKDEERFTWRSYTKRAAGHVVQAIPACPNPP